MEKKLLLQIFKREVSKLNDRNSINKLYRQFRVWTHIETDILENMSIRQKYSLNEKFNNIRLERFEELRISLKEEN